MGEMTENGFGMNADWLHDVRRVYLLGAPRKLAELERAISGLEMNPMSRSHEHRLRLLLHNLIGSGGSYGFPAVTDAARGMSERLKQRHEDGVPISPEILVDLRKNLEMLRRIFDEAQA